MAHVAHLFVPGPWESPRLTLPEPAARHLHKVLRTRDGDPVSYTDGVGTLGAGVYRDGAVERGEEEAVPAEVPRLVLAVAPPKSTDRVRFLIEKATELAVAEIRWLETRHGEGRPPRTEKATAWTGGALEQCRGAWATTVGASEGVDLATLAAAADGALLVAHPGGAPLLEAVDGVARDGAGTVTIAVGPEGGFAADEIPPTATIVGLGPRILRVETAALTAAAAIRLARPR